MNAVRAHDTVVDRKGPAELCVKVQFPDDPQGTFGGRIVLSDTVAMVLMRESVKQMISVAPRTI